MSVTEKEITDTVDVPKESLRQVKQSQSETIHLRWELRETHSEDELGVELSNFTADYCQKYTTVIEMEENRHIVKEDMELSIKKVRAVQKKELEILQALYDAQLYALDQEVRKKVKAEMEQTEILFAEISKKMATLAKIAAREEATKPPIENTEAAEKLQDKTDPPRAGVEPNIGFRVREKLAEVTEAQAEAPMGESAQCDQEPEVERKNESGLEIEKAERSDTEGRAHPETRDTQSSSGSDSESEEDEERLDLDVGDLSKEFIQEEKYERKRVAVMPPDTSEAEVQEVYRSEGVESKEHKKPRLEEPKNETRGRDASSSRKKGRKTVKNIDGQKCYPHSFIVEVIGKDFNNKDKVGRLMEGWPKVEKVGEISEVDRDGYATIGLTGHLRNTARMIESFMEIEENRQTFRRIIPNNLSKHRMSLREVAESSVWTAATRPESQSSDRRR